MKMLIWVCALCICQLASAADVFDGSQPRPFKLADRLEADATIGGYPLWQNWRLFDISKTNSVGSAVSVPMGTVRLFQTDNKKFVAVMTVSANLAQGNAADWSDEPCKREDLLFKVSTGGVFSNVNCATINHLVAFPGNPSGKSAEFYALLKEQGVEIPPTVLQIAFTRYTNNLRRLNVFLSINPELAGFPRDVETQWGRSPWHKSQAFSDPKKKQFIDALGVWALQFSKQMDAAFDKKHDAFSLIPSWRSGEAVQPSVDLMKEKVTLD
jgi:hypothetical protein